MVVRDLIACIVSIAVVALTPIAAFAQTPARAAASAPDRTLEPRIAPRAIAARTPVAPTIDGRLDDLAWSQASVIDTFTQRDPVEGTPASEPTEVWIVYDQEALYVGARLHDRRPVTSRLARRDMATTSSDWFRVSIDSFHDRRMSITRRTSTGTPSIISIVRSWC